MKQSSKKTVMAIIQSRMGSTRLPGKMLMSVCDGKGPLEMMLERIRRARRLDRVVVATTVSVSDDPLEKLCGKLYIPCFRGSEDDVLDRYFRAAQALGPAEAIVRLTGDCPLHDPEIIDRTVSLFLASDLDYVSNVIPPSFPDGLDTEVFSMAVLEKAWREARLTSEREHVTPYIHKHPELFRMGSVVNDRDLSGLRWTLDEPRDLEFIRAVYARLGSGSFGMDDVLRLLDACPDLGAVNAGIERNAGYRRSLERDRVVRPAGAGS